MKVKIGADVSGLEAGVTQAQNSLNKLRPAVTGAGQTLTNFNRVVQDAPFGLIAIQNNIEPLFQSFGDLKAQTGSTSGALKALGASLIGPTGVLVAISAVTSLVTSAVQKYGSLGKAFEALVNSGNALYQSQQQLLSIQREATKNAGEEIAKLTVLNAVATDTTGATVNRVEAANELLRVYKEYLPNLTQEAILNNNAADAINKAKDAILNKALAAAAEKKLAEVGAKVLDNQLAQIEAVRRYGTAQTDLATQVKKANAEGLKGREGVNTQTVFFNTQLDKAQNNLAEIGKESVALQKEFTTLTTLAAGFARQAGGAFVKDVAAPKIPTVKQKVGVLELLPERATLGVSQTAADIDILRQFRLDNGLQVPVNLEVPQAAFDSLNKFGENAKNALDLKSFKAQAAEFKAILTEGLAQPLGDLFFNFLDQGKIGFKEFADTAIKSIKRIVAQLIASKIIQLLGNLFAPGVGSAAGLLGGSSGLFSGLFQSANLNVGALGSGGLSLSGGVRLEARGADLVGVISAANARIGRVG